MSAAAAGAAALESINVARPDAMPTPAERLRQLARLGRNRCAQVSANA